MEKKRFRVPLRIITVLILAAVLVLWGIYMLSQPCDRTDLTYKNFTVEEGASVPDVASALEEEELVKSASRFRMLSKLTLSGDLRPGTYLLSPSMSGISIINTLKNGITTSTGFTIPAGYTVDQIATALDRDGLADKDSFLKAAESPELAQLEILTESKGSDKLSGKELIEGFLFPAEYTINGDVDENMMIIMMVDAFSNFYNEDYRARADEMGMDVRDVLAIASVIEKETQVDKERAAISAVIHNRYNLEMTPEEEIYDVPLCSPSKESIIAALYPEENDNIYYVLSSKLDGTHKFTADEAEFNALTEEYNAAVAERDSKEAAQKAESGEGGEADQAGSENGEE